MRAEDIQWVEAQGDYALLHASGSSGMIRRTLAQLESGLGPNFIRVHRSAVVRREAIVSVTRRQSGALSLTLKDGSSVPAGRSYVRGLGELRKRV
nr:LytTR family DNA-binding domain-containing protein [Alteripontixanthobacter muriae]